VRRLVPQLGEPRMVAVGLAATAAGLVALPWVPSYDWLYAVAPVIALGNGLALPSFTSLYSKACHSEQAGELLGHSQAMATTGRIAGPLWAGWVMGNVALGAPFWIAGLLMLLALVLFLALRSTLIHVDS
jgi:predicted MFS family arabinose efflux permease